MASLFRGKNRISKFRVLERREEAIGIDIILFFLSSYVCTHFRKQP